MNNLPYFCLPENNGHQQMQDGAVAQLVEQRTENPCVAGSIPAHTTENTIKRFVINILQSVFV